MFILLDPRSQEEITVGFLGDNQKPIFKIYRRNQWSLLEFVTQQLNAKHSALNALAGMVIIPGPGGFSNVRAAAVLANTVSFALAIPIAEVRARQHESREELFQKGIAMFKARQRKPGQEIVKPIYGSEPNITKPR